MEEKEILKDTKKKEQYINKFKEVFEIKNIKFDISQMPLLKYLMDKFGEDLYVMSDESIKLLKRKNKIFEELEESLTEEQKGKLEEYWDLEGRISYEMGEQLFMYGFILAQELENEKNNVKRSTKK